MVPFEGVATEITRVRAPPEPWTVEWPIMLEAPEMPVGQEELRSIERSMQRIFFGACGLSVCLITVLLVSLRAGGKDVPTHLLVAVSGLLLWSLGVTAYAFRVLYRFAENIKEQLEYRAFVDELTGVFNFRYLDQRLKEEYERTRRYGGATGVLFMDLDHFKRVNDTLGHQVGNDVLTGIAQVMRHEMRSCDVLGRLGGDEFIAVLPQTDRSQAEVLANRLREAVAAFSLVADEGKVVDFVRVSIGVAVYPSNGDSIESVISAADSAVYEAKGRGGNAVHVTQAFVTTEQMGEKVVRRVEQKAD